MLAASLQVVGGSSKCEEISNMLCLSVLPYNLTRFPNMAGDVSQASALGSIQELGQDVLTHANCSKDALFLLCSFYLPMCMPNEASNGLLKPCRSLCERVRFDCVPKIKKWPREAKCEEMPEFSESICIQPDSFISSLSPPTSNCQDQQKFDGRMYISRQYDYVIKYRVTHVEKNEHRKIVSLTGRVGRVFKVGNLTLSRGQSNVKIWRGTDSSCPFRFALHRSYAIGGYENDSHTKLLLSPTSLILKWSEKTLKKIRSWDRVEKGKKDKIGKRFANSGSPRRTE